MWRKLAAVGAVGAAIAGVGTAALATSGTVGGNRVDSSTVRQARSETAAGVRKDIRRQLRNAVHGQWVTRGADGTFVTHDLYRGSVTASSATSITVKAADGTSLTYGIDKNTKVTIREGGSVHTGNMGDVKVGDKVLVTGEGRPQPTANHVVDATN